MKKITKSYMRKITLILFMIVSNVSISENILDDSDGMEIGENSYVKGSNGISLTKNSIAIGTNSNSLDNYFEYYNPNLTDKSKIENEIQKTKEDIDNRVKNIKEQYINRLKRINYIESQMKIINNFFIDKQKVEMQLKQVTDDRDRFIKVANTIILKTQENNYKLITQIGTYRATLRKIADYLIDKKGLVNGETIENAIFKDDADDNRNSNLSKAKIKEFINDQIVWDYLKLDDENNLKKYLSNCIKYKLKEPMAGNVYDISGYYGKPQDNNIINENVKDIKAKIKTYRLPLIQSFLEAHKEFEIDKMDNCSEELYKIAFRNKVSHYNVRKTYDELNENVKNKENLLNNYKERTAYFTEWKEKFNDELKELLKSIKYEGEDNLAYGTSSYAIGVRSYAIGTKALTMGADSITMGSYSATFGNGSNSIGEKNYTKGDKNQVFGVENITVGNNNILHGNNNEIYGENNIVLGNGVKINKKNNAVVIGNGSKAIENAVSIGNDGTTRQIKYVKAGTDDTDAVNVKQLKDYVAAKSKGLEDINAKSNLALSGVANAIAMSSMTQPRKGLVNITGAYGTYGGEHALAVGIGGNTERLSYKLGVSTNMKGNVGVGLGFGVTVASSTKDDVIKTMEKKILEYMKESKEQNERIKELENEMKELRKLIKRN